MLEREPTQKITTSPDYGLKKCQVENGMEDLIRSISHRLGSVESCLSMKIDRVECMAIMEGKVGFNQVRKIVDQINLRYEKDRKLVAEQLALKAQQSKQQLQKYKQKLQPQPPKRKQQKPSSNPHLNPSTSQKSLQIKPQQLYLQSNETMFSLIVDQISAVKEAQSMMERSLEQRNKVTLGLHNQVWAKLEDLEKEIQGSVKLMREYKRESKMEESRGYWSSSDHLESQKQSSKPQPLSQSPTIPNFPNSPNPQPHQITHILRTLQSLQKDLSTKINIKDILTLIKKNLQPLSQNIEQIRKYTEEAILSTKKILMNQSEINQELCAVSRVGWWWSYEDRDGVVVWGKEIANLVPEVFVCSKDGTEVLLTQQGTYLLKILSTSNQPPESIIIGENEVQILGETLIKVQKNTAIQVPASGEELFMMIQKI